MSRHVSIVVYHFVRDLRHSRFPEIKGLNVGQFKEQIEYILKYYNVITINGLLAALEEGESLPPRAMLLTFDDGYIDHFTNVFPVLNKYGLQGLFFPPAKAITEHTVLDVNKIHFILAATKNKAEIVRYIMKTVDEAGTEHALRKSTSYYTALAKPNRFDSSEVIFIKRMLQREIPEPLRNALTSDLFRKYVTEDEEAFSRELYMSSDQLQCMLGNGMFIGSHGYDHYWLNTLDSASQEHEIELSLHFLKDIGCSLDHWAMSYPYGAYNESLLSVLRAKGCDLGFTTEVGIADFNRDDPLLLPRLDTNDLPKKRDAVPNHWTSQVGVGVDI